MPRIHAQIFVQEGNVRLPLRRTYVEQLVAGVPVATFLTDNQGDIRDENGDLGIESLAAWVDIRVLCQNSVVKVLNGEAANHAVWQDFQIQNNDNVVISGANRQINHYRILNSCLDVYDSVFRQFNVYSELSRPDFPLGRRARLSDSKNQRKRLEVSFPDRFHLAALAFVEPRSLSTGYPLIHFKGADLEPRLFGNRDHTPIVIPAEMSHGLHFATLSAEKRQELQDHYLYYIITSYRTTGGEHFFDAVTTPQVAFLEALDHFSYRFFLFRRSGLSTRRGAGLRQDFFRAELAGADYWMGRFPDSLSFPQAGKLTNGRIEPELTGGNVEGAVYGAIFLDFARRVGLLTAVNAYFRSKALSFGEYREYIQTHRPQHAAQIRAVADTWGL